MQTLDTVNVYTVFLDGAKFGVTMRNKHGVLEICSIHELLNEATITEKGLSGLQLGGYVAWFITNWFNIAK